MPARDPLDVVDRFDGEVAWTALPELLRTAIGAALLERESAAGLIARGEDEADDRLACVGRAASRAADMLLDRALSLLSADGWDTASGQPRIPLSLGTVCAECGCSQEDACPEICVWARADLCTACAPVQTAAA